MASTGISADIGGAHIHRDGLDLVRRIAVDETSGGGTRCPGRRSLPAAQDVASIVDVGLGLWGKPSRRVGV
jgi:hypothetical protein